MAELVPLYNIDITQLTPLTCSFVQYIEIQVQGSMYCKFKSYYLQNVYRIEDLHLYNTKYSCNTKCI